MTTYVNAPTTPYKLAGIILAATGIEVRPQQLYSAAAHGQLKFRLSETGTKVVDPADANEFIETFAARRVERLAKRAAKAEAKAAAPVAETKASKAKVAAAKA
jgi:hypothetical protein